MDFLEQQTRPTTEVEVLGIQRVPPTGGVLNENQARRWRIASRLWLVFGVLVGVVRHVQTPYSVADVQWAIDSARESLRWRKIDRQFKRRKKE